MFLRFILMLFIIVLVAATVGIIYLLYTNKLHIKMWLSSEYNNQIDAEKELDEFIQLTLANKKLNKQLKFIYKEGRTFEGAQRELVQREYLMTSILEPVIK